MRFQGDYMNTKKICISGVLIAVSMIFSYIDNLIIIIPSIPFVKLGLANVCLMYCLYKMPAGYGFIILFMRIVLSGITFTSFSYMLYSLCGGLLAFIVMYILIKFKVFSVIAVSAAGGVFHNMGQLLIAYLVLQTKAVIAYIPPLVITGTLTGVIIGVISKIIINRLDIKERT